MIFSTLLAAVSLVPSLVSAAPARFYGKRAESDILVFKFADVLEQLESEFYRQALAKFQSQQFIDAGFASSQVPVEQFTTIQADEATHSVVLQAALKSFGEQPITTCTFNFDSALTDVATMAATARVVEAVGVGAYIGGATLLTDPVLLTAAASILTVEARHQTVLNILSSVGTAVPAAFDLALTPSEVLALAGPFISGCDVGIPANPVLSVTNTGTVAPGTQLTFSSPALDASVDTSMMLGGQPFSIALPFNACVVPEGINGPVAIFITSDSQPLLNNVRDRATTQLVAGPTIAFIDTRPQTLGQLARVNGDVALPGSAAPIVSTSTRTISPAEASALIAAGGSTQTAPAPASPTDASAGAAATPVAASAGAPAPVATAAGASAAAGGPNEFIGPSADGTITVTGWSMSSSS
ncbi:hypothetical protein CVT24_012595 [Panaeolus cyanescens]|uniref:Ferritin-like domain-containing protein n=1 Tax=Panaeolus cyanescens TaxID=181874 RepID=A0A409YJT8_9AGAR|nr:hypothetical protein CVT24_012595 [Panaeolus cyanescens]